MHLPNQGRKVLLFSDSRQRAARLARDIAEASDDTAIRQLFALAISEMERIGNGASMDQFYGYFVLAAARQDLRIFHEPDRSKFADDCEKVKEEFLELFNAWIISVCDKATALGHTINDAVRKEVRPLYGGYGLDKDGDFSENIRKTMSWEKKDPVADVWKRIFRKRLESC